MAYARKLNCRRLAQCGGATELYVGQSQRSLGRANELSHRPTDSLTRNQKEVTFRRVLGSDIQAGSETD